MSALSSRPSAVGAAADLDGLLAEIARGAAARDAAPAPGFPEGPIAALERAGVLAWGATGATERPPAAGELALVRRVAAADASVGRILDGHLNALERLAAQAPEEVRDRELATARAGTLRAGVWGGGPVPGEGPPARVLRAARTGAHEVLRGVKTFCSGAGGLHRALVLAAGQPGEPPSAVWIEVTEGEHVEIDTGWYRSHGLRASESHRVVFHDAPVIARFGGPGSLLEQPWFARDALRTAASWAGMADSAVASALAELGERPEATALEGLAAGRMLTAQGTIDRWLEAAAAAMDVVTAGRGAPAGLGGGARVPAQLGEPAAPELASLALYARAAIADACRVILDEAARACGSGPFARGGALDRARRDLEVFLLQHRLDPMLARAGLAAVEALR